MTHPEDERTYVDLAGFQEYSGRNGWEIRVERLVPMSPERAWDSWFTSIWEGQERPVMIDPGLGRGRLASVRRVPLAGLTERIVGAGLPSSRPDAVPSISYTLEHFAATSYLGYVRFVPTEPDAGTTRIVWCVKWTPSLAGRLLFVGGHLLAGLLRSAINQMLDGLEQEARQAQP